MGGRIWVIICTDIIDIGMPKGIPGKPMGIIPSGGIGGIPIGGGTLTVSDGVESSVSLPASRRSWSRRSSSGIPSMP